MLSICVKYVKYGQPLTTFHASTEFSDCGAYTVVGEVHSVILSLGLDLTKCVSLATQGKCCDGQEDWCRCAVEVQVSSIYFTNPLHCS